jgi:hypothetical protein
MFWSQTAHLRVLIALGALALSACTSKASFNKTISTPNEQTAGKTVSEPSPTPSPSTVVSLPNPAQSISPVKLEGSPRLTASALPQSTASPLPTVPAKTIPSVPVSAPVKTIISPTPQPSQQPAAISSADISGSYVSADSDLEISETKTFVMHTEALSSLKTASSGELCKIDREGTIDSLGIDGTDPVIRLDITSEKFSSAQTGNGNADFCAQVGNSFSQPHSLSIPVSGAGKGYLVLELKEASSDGLALTSPVGLLSGLFYDSDSATDITLAFFQVLSGSYSGAFGGFYANLPVPRLSLTLDSKSETVTLLDNECAFSVVGPLNATGSSGTIVITAKSGSLVVKALDSAAEKTYDVYYGRVSGGCAQRKQSFLAQLTGSGVKLGLSPQSGRYSVDFSGAQGTVLKYTIRPN